MDEKLMDAVGGLGPVTITMLDNGCACVIWPDNSEAILRWRGGEWHFVDSAPSYDAATATGMYDR